MPDFVPFDNEARRLLSYANGTFQLNDEHKLFGVIQYDSRLRAATSRPRPRPFIGINSRRWCLLAATELGVEPRSSTTRLQVS